MDDRSRRFPPLDSLRAAPARLLILFGVLLIVADLLGPNPFIDADYLSLEIEVALGLTAIVVAMAERLSDEQRSRFRSAVLAMLLSVAVAGVAAEAATRWVFRDVTASADGGGYFSRHRSRGDHFNDHGFRERQFSMARPPGVYRVAVIGDSFTFGNGLDMQERYTDVLNRWLGDRFEILNFGSPGHNTPHHLDTLRGRVLRASPNFVLLQWFVNDIEGHDLSGRPQPAFLIPHPELHRWLNRHSALYTVANLRWAEIQIMLGWVPSYADYLEQLAGDSRSFAAHEEAQLLHEFVQTTRAAGADVAILLFPDPGQDLGRNYPFAFLHERVLAVCRQEAIPCVDLRQDLALVKDRRTLWVSPFDHHPSAKANEIAALRILDRLQNRWTQ